MLALMITAFIFLLDANSCNFTLTNFNYKKTKGVLISPTVLVSTVLIIDYT